MQYATTPTNHGKFPFRRLDSINIHQFSQFSSVAQSCATLCDPMNCSTPGLPVHHQLQAFTQTHVHRVSDASQPSHPQSSPSPPAPNPSQHQSLFSESTLHMRWPKYWIFSFSIIPSIDIVNERSWIPQMIHNLIRSHFKHLRTFSVMDSKYLIVYVAILTLKRRKEQVDKHIMKKLLTCVTFYIISQLATSQLKVI